MDRKGRNKLPVAFSVGLAATLPQNVWWLAARAYSSDVTNWCKSITIHSLVELCQFSSAEDPNIKLCVMQSGLESLIKYSALQFLYKLQLLLFNSETWGKLVCLNDDYLQNVYSRGHKKKTLASFLFVSRKSMIKAPLVLLVHPALKLISFSI